MEWRTASMHLKLMDDGIVIITPPSDFEGPETLEHAHENVQTRDKYVGDKLKGILAHLPSHYVNAAATGYYKKEAPSVPIALVGNSTFKTMLGNFLLSVTKPGRPVKLFIDEDDAFAWLQEKIK